MTTRQVRLAAGASRALPYAGLLAAMASFQLGASFAERLFPLAGAQGVAALRITIAAAILLATSAPWRGLTRKTLNWRNVGPLIAYGVSLGAMNTLFYMALQTLPLGVAVAIEFVGPLGVALAASRRPSDLAWVGVAAAGLLLLLPTGLTRGVDTRGALLALAAGACWAAYILFGRRAGDAYGTRATGLGLLIATACFLPPQMVQHSAALFSARVLPIAALVALLSSALPYSLEMYALTRMPTRVFGTLMSLEPAIGALAGLALLGQRLAPLQWAGIGAVMLASAGAAGAGAGARPPAGAREPLPL
ncbi:MAG TPA: EamA family transporter [Caulobacteraceae bacterium]|jgi:inner membrane transporter RhtA|nr:EamA family transporter [Caulobacteraceae bacterium]